MRVLQAPESRPQPMPPAPGITQPPVQVITTPAVQPNVAAVGSAVPAERLPTGPQLTPQHTVQAPYVWFCLRHIASLTTPLKLWL
jgi:hypothetical protein